jgi:hypothetical protein
VKFSEKLAFIPALILGGIELWVRPPRRLKLTVDHDFEARREREHQELLAEGFSDAVLPHARPYPPLKCVHMDQHYRRQGQEFRSGCSIAVNYKTRRIDYTYSSEWLLGKEHQGSGMIGVALFSLPFMVPLAPFLWLASKYYRTMEKRRGLSCHGHALLKALRGQIDPETEALLTEALKNDWKHDQEMARKVTLEEAKEVLGRCDLHEDTVDEERAAEEDEPGDMRGFHWFNDQEDQIAQGNFYEEREHFVEVLGSRFEGEAADALIGCFRSREVHIHGCAK